MRKTEGWKIKEGQHGKEAVVLGRDQGAILHKVPSVDSDRGWNQSHWRNSVLRTQVAAVPRHDWHHRRRMPVWTMGRGPDRPADQSFPGTGGQPGLSSLCGGVGIVRFGRRLYGQGRTVP